MPEVRVGAGRGHGRSWQLLISDPEPLRPGRCALGGAAVPTLPSLQIERILGVRLQAGLRAWTQVLLGQAEDKAEVDMDTDAPQVSHKPGGEPKIKVSVSQSSPSASKQTSPLDGPVQTPVDPAETGQAPPRPRGPGQHCPRRRVWSGWVSAAVSQLARPHPVPR